MDLYSPGEIARAAGVSQAEVLAALGRTASSAYVVHDEAVRIGRMLAAHARVQAMMPPKPLFLVVARPAERHRLVGLVFSGSVHAAIAIGVLIAGLSIAPAAAVLRAGDASADTMRLVFLATPGPGGGGGGGGMQQSGAPPRAMLEGRNRISSPVRRARPIEPVVSPPEPPPLESEQLPVVVAPVVAVSADTRTRIGVLEQSRTAESSGPGSNGGAGAGSGGGLGPGIGDGIGPGARGGTGGGPFRPGSGITPPRLLHEVKPDYTEEARQRNIAGDVVLEIVVRRDGSVGEVRLLKGLSAGLNERAVHAVRQWKFAPAQRLGSAVDVVVEVAVEFTLR